MGLPFLAVPSPGQRWLPVGAQLLISDCCAELVNGLSAEQLVRLEFVPEKGILVLQLVSVSHKAGGLTLYEQRVKAVLDMQRLFSMSLQPQEGVLKAAFESGEQLSSVVMAFCAAMLRHHSVGRQASRKQTWWQPCAKAYRRCLSCSIFRTSACGMGQVTLAAGPCLS
jgi:hypothetical protein